MGDGEEKTKFDRLALNDALQHRTGSKVLAKRITEALIQSIIDQLCKKGSCRIKGLGKFKVVKRPGRIGRNPKTGVRADIPEHLSISFTVDKSLAEIAKQENPKIPSQLNYMLIYGEKMKP